MPGLAVGHPVRKGGDHIDPVETLSLSKAHIILKPGLRSNWTLLFIIVPTKPICPQRPPGIPQHEEWCPIGLLQGVMIRRRAQKPTAQRMGLFLSFGPG